MNATIKSLVERRSIRAYEPEQIKEEELQAMLETGYYAPSSMGKQARHVVVIQKPEVMEKITELVKAALIEIHFEKYFKHAHNEKYAVNWDAPTFIIVSGDPEASSLAAGDCGLFLGNFFAAGESLGIGTCWINQLNPVCDVPEVRAYLTELGVPTNHQVYGCASVGYPRGIKPQPVPRKENRVTFVR
ncbi:MAG: nitroreductase family protein [Negativicutes bacterium]|nr:nitroreductase family protein [Negativicutes bacterium]